MQCAVYTGQHRSGITTTQVIHNIEIVLSIYWINSTKYKQESNHHFKYPGQNTVNGMFKFSLNDCYVENQPNSVSMQTNIHSTRIPNLVYFLCKIAHY